MLRRIREGYGCKAGAPGTAVVLLKECPVLLLSWQLLLLIFLISYCLLVLGKADLRNYLCKGQTLNVPVNAQILYWLRSSEGGGIG